MEASIVVHPRWGGTRHEVGGFERFFRANYGVVVGIARSVVGDAHLAHDVAQDVFIAAERRFPDPSGSDHAAAWVRTAAVHLALNAVRGRKRRDSRQRGAASELPAAGPEEILLDREAQSELRSALGRLPEHAAALLLLRHSGLSYAEVAHAMDVNVNQVGTMLRRAEAALRKEVERATRS